MEEATGGYSISQPGHIASCPPPGLTTSRPSVRLPALAPRYHADMSQRYRCLPCGHVYDLEEGDPTSDIPPGTAKADFEPLSD